MINEHVPADMYLFIQAKRIISLSKEIQASSFVCPVCIIIFLNGRLFYMFTIYDLVLSMKKISYF